eukprot:gene17630-23973_t
MLPPFWSRPKNKWKSCAPCPPVGYQPAVAVGRAMAETDLFHPEFSRIARRMDEIWTPSHFSLEVLNKSGIPVDKIRVVPLAVNTTYFDPDSVESTEVDRPFVFSSCFKWESRKGWDVLLNAYLSEFTSADNVELYILTKPFQGSDYKADMQSWVTKNIGAISNASMPTLYVIPTHVSNSEYVGLLKASDAYVMPTRGEGWGMPISEAMSMALPVIVTNWSGPTAFVDKSIGYPLTKYTLVDVGPEEPWWFRGARWADVDVQHLRQASVHLIAAEMDRLNNMLRSGGPCDRCFNSEWVAPPGDTKPAYYSGKEPFLKKMDTVGGLVASSDKNKRHRTKMDGFQSKSSRNASSRASKSLDRGNRVSASHSGGKRAVETVAKGAHHQ